jgi:hypothetical protein
MVSYSHTRENTRNLHVTQNVRGVQGDIRDQDNHVAKDGHLGSWAF